jgi:hypothetical protein
VRIPAKLNARSGDYKRRVRAKPYCHRSEATTAVWSRNSSSELGRVIVSEVTHPFIRALLWHVMYPGAREDSKEEQRSLWDGSQQRPSATRALAPPA